MCTAGCMQEGGIYTTVADIQPPRNPTNTKQSFMTCSILKRPADCTRPGSSRLSFTPKPWPKQCVGKLEIPGLPFNCQDHLFRLTSLHPRQIGGALPLCRKAAGEFYPPPPCSWGIVRTTCT